MMMYTLNGNMGNHQVETVGIYVSIALARKAAKKVRDSYCEMTIERHTVNAPALDTANGEEHVVVEIL